MKEAVFGQWQEILEHLKEIKELSDEAYCAFIKPIVVTSVDKEKLELTIGGAPEVIKHFKKKYSETLEKSIYDITGKKYSLILIEITPEIEYTEELCREMEKFLSKECSEKIIYIYGLMQSDGKQIGKMVNDILQKQGRQEGVKCLTSETFLGEIIWEIKEKTQKGHDFDYAEKMFIQKYLAHDFLMIEGLQYLKAYATSKEMLTKILKARILAGKKTMLGSDRSFTDLCEIIPGLRRIVVMNDEVLYPRSVVI